MADRIAELQKEITEGLATLEHFRRENIPLVADSIAALRKSLGQIESPKQRRAIAAIIDNHETFSNVISVFAESLIATFSELQSQFDEIIRSNIKAHEQARDIVSGHMTPSQN